MNHIDLYTKALELARDNRQVVGEKNDYYITVAQLEGIIMKLLASKQ